jgi:hypothetical protein
MQLLEERAHLRQESQDASDQEEEEDIKPDSQGIKVPTASQRKNQKNSSGPAPWK